MNPNPHLKDMKRWALLFARDTEKAADLVQDTCVRLLKQRYDPERGMSERSFVYIVMRSVHIRTLDSANRLKRNPNEISLDWLPEGRQPSFTPRQENMIYACELLEQARGLPRGQQRALGKIIAGDKLTHSERTMLGKARKAFGKAPMVSKRRTQ